MSTRVSLNPAVFNQSLFKTLLRFWLPSYPTPPSSVAQSDAARWFSRSDAVDEQCRTIAGPALSAIGPRDMPLPEFKSLEADRERYESLSAPFAPLLEPHDDGPAAAGGALQPAHTALALTILLDQMPRNVFRDAAQAQVYTHYDRLARAVAAQIRAKGLDRHESLVDVPLWRLWFYLPLEHCESPEDHRIFRRTLVEMLGRARDRSDKDGEGFVQQAIDFEDRHHAPLETFGRYPWRNRWLGRESTAEEERWLREGGDTFGTG